MSSSPATIRSAVVLPHPDGPTSTMNSPSSIAEIDRVHGPCAIGIDLAHVVERDFGHQPLPPVRIVHSIGPAASCQSTTSRRVTLRYRHAHGWCAPPTAGRMRAVRSRSFLRSCSASPVSRRSLRSRPDPWRSSPTPRTCSRTRSRSAWPLFAAWLAHRPATPQRSFGWRRAEVLAALVNALVARRSRRGDRLGRDRPPVGSARGPRWLGARRRRRRAHRERRRGARLHGAGSGLNVRAAMLHVLADLASSAGVVVAGLVVLATGWAYADPIMADPDRLARHREHCRRAARDRRGAAGRRA